MKNTMMTSGIAIVAMAAHPTNSVNHDNGRESISAHVSSIPDDSAALKAVNHFFDRFKSGATAEELASYFDEKADYFIPGDTKHVPWIGQRKDRAAIRESFQLLKENIQPQKLVFTDILTKGNRVVVLGYLESIMKSNQKLMKSEFSIDILVENGLLTRYHLLEDSFEVSEKAKR